MDLYIKEKFLDAPICIRFINEIRRAESTAALSYGHSDSGLVDNKVRRVRSARISDEISQHIMAKLNQELSQLQKYFDLSPGDWEQPEFLWYATGDFFVAHQDGNTGLIKLESDRLRRISVSIFLNSQTDEPAPDSYCGGALVFTDYRKDEEFVLRGEAGTLVAFRSELTHEVRPVTCGDRFAIVVWYRVGSHFAS